MVSYTPLLLTRHFVPATLSADSGFIMCQGAESSGLIESKEATEMTAVITHNKHLQHSVTLYNAVTTQKEQVINNSTFPKLKFYQLRNQKPEKWYYSVIVGGASHSIVSRLCWGGNDREKRNNLGFNGPEAPTLFSLGHCEEGSRECFS
jgi:hypothetical protein